MVIKVFPQYYLEVWTPVGLVICLSVVLEHFLWKVYTTITAIVGDKWIGLAYPIPNLELSKEVAAVSMFSNNVQYQIKKPLKVPQVHSHHLEPLQGSNASTRTPTAIPMAIKVESIVMPCSLYSIHSFSANEVSLSSTFEIIFLIPIIWLVSLPLRRVMLSCLAFSLLLLFLMSSQIPSLYSGLFLISVSLQFPSLCVLSTVTFLPSSPLVNL